MGSFMSGGDAWASVDPSTNSTIEWTTDCGWTTTWMRSNGTSKSRCASMTSRPLLTRVAEFVVMTGPMAQVGWARACSGVTSCELVPPHPPERSPARRDHEPLDLVGRPAAQALGEGRVLTVHGDDLAGLGGGLDQRPPDDERLLVGQGEGRPGVERGERRRQADRAGDPVEDDVGGATGEDGRGVRAGQQLGPVCVLSGLPCGLGHGCGELVDGAPRAPDGLDLQLHGLAGQQREVAAGAQRGDAEPVGRGLRDLDRLGADGTGRPEQGHGPRRGGHPSIVPPASRSIARLVMERVTGSCRNRTGRK